MYLHELFPTEYYEYLEQEGLEKKAISDFQFMYPDKIQNLRKVEESLIDTSIYNPIDFAGILNNQKIGIELTEYYPFESAKEYIASWFRFSNELKILLSTKNILNLRGTFFFKEMKDSLHKQDHEKYFKLHKDKDFMKRMADLIKNNYDFSIKDTQAMQEIIVDDKDVGLINCEYYEGDHKYPWWNSKFQSGLASENFRLERIQEIISQKSFKAKNYIGHNSEKLDQKWLIIFSYGRTLLTPVLFFDFFMDHCFSFGEIYFDKVIIFNPTFAEIFTVYPKIETIQTSILFR